MALEWQRPMNSNIKTKLPIVLVENGILDVVNGHLLGMDDTDVSDYARDSKPNA